MGNEESRIIEDIRNSLLDYDIPYEEGRWESFQKHYQKELNSLDQPRNSKLVYLWKYAATTAAAIIFIIVILYSPQSRVKDKDVAGQNERNLNNPVKKDVAPLNKSENIENRKTAIHQSMATMAKENPFAGTQLHSQNIRKDVAMIEPALSDAIRADSLKHPGKEKKINLYANNGENPPSHFDYPETTADHSGRWEFGIELNPSFVSDRISLGVGVSTQFEVSKRIKLATGLSYSNINAIYKADRVQISSDTSMIGGQSVIKALDIPLSIIYERDNGWYAAVGVSALAVLKENKTYEFESRVLQETFSTDPENGEAVSVFQVVESHFKEQSTDTDFKGRHNLSYINLAVGKQYKLYNNKKILLEPFVKIPMGALNNDNINLFNSGVKIKLLF